MTGQLTPQISDALLGARDADLLPRIPRSMQRAVDAQTARGLVWAARAQANAYAAHTRIEGASFVARMGMQRVAELSAEEVCYTAQTPMAEARYRAIADSFAALVNNEVIKLGYEL
jgi:hypothetical protein